MSKYLIFLFFFSFFMPSSRFFCSNFSFFVLGPLYVEHFFLSIFSILLFPALLGWGAAFFLVFGVEFFSFRCLLLQPAGVAQFFFWGGVELISLLSAVSFFSWGSTVVFLLFFLFFWGGELWFLLFILRSLSLPPETTVT